MKKIAITALSATIIASTGLTSLHAGSNYVEPTKEAILARQQDSSAMRTKYYNEYKTKGYDMSSLEAYLDASKTSDSEYWAAFKRIKDSKEIPERRTFVEKLKSQGYNVDNFSEEIILDSGKFWAMVKSVQASKPATDVNKEEYKKSEPVKQDYKKDEYKKEEYKKVEPVKKENKDEYNTKEAKKAPSMEEKSQIYTEKLKTLMKDRIAKLPADTREATLARIESSLMKAIESAKSKNATRLATRYQVLLAVVQAEMDDSSDEDLVNSLFN